MTLDTITSAAWTDDDPRYRSSVIRDLLVHARRPGVISLAGGLPAPELLATEVLGNAMADVMATGGRDALQYGLTEGETPMVDAILRDFPGMGPANVLVTAGSQQALALAAAVLAGPQVAGAPAPVALIEQPGYIGALQALRAAGLEPIGVPVDGEGLVVEELERILGELSTRGVTPRFCYVNPTFQNPTGASLSPERTERLLKIAEANDLLLIADDPYKELFLDGDRPDGIAPAPGVLSLGSLSKTLSPALRVGWAVGPAPLIARMTLAKQPADLQTSTLTQAVAATALGDERWWQAHLAGLRTRYAERRQALLDAVTHHLPEATITPQRGGFFLWLDLSAYGVTDAKAALERALDAGVAFVPGSASSISAEPAATIRLSYSSGDPDTFDEAIRRLAAALAP